MRGTLIQALLLTLVVGAFLYFTSNAVSNMARLGISSGYAFLDRPANFGIGEFMVPYSPADTYGRAILVGLLNTIKVAMAGCVLATILGIFLGILRLTNNPLLSTLIQGYIEIIRNVPLLLQLFFWYAVAQKFPGPRDAFQPLPGFFLSNRGVKVPWLEWTAQHDIMLLAAVIGVVISLFVRKASDRKRDATGVGFLVFPWAIGLIFGVPAIIGVIIGAPIYRAFGSQADGVSDEEAGAVESDPREVERAAEREAKLREIREAELDWRTGKLSEDDWRLLDSRLRAEAAELLKDSPSMDPVKPGA